ncbi:MAG: hypothetical protein HY445_02615 [Candidatus Niyogibacteria bacterium]|nr:hypothetical protein [Candidatus Niyogibacteria bacterium]
MDQMYFAHPVNIYGEPIERAFEILIANTLSDGDMSVIENPNQPHHQEAYMKYAVRKQESDKSHGGMNYFFAEVLPKCGRCVALPFLDGRMGLGVANETRWYVEQNRPSHIIRLRHDDEKDNQFSLRYQDFIQNPMNGLFIVTPITEQEIISIMANDPALVVPHEETRLRTWIVYGRSKRPYSIAHLARLPIPEAFYSHER